MPENNPAAKVSLSFAKLVATPTDNSWSQAYNAGNLFACLSLAVEEATEELSLQALGKELFNVLQSEFFTLEEKNTASIKAAIQTSLEKLPEHVTVSLVLAFFKETTLFVFIAGSGKIVMKREEKVGILLAKQREYDGTVSSAAGFVNHTDTIILETGQFAQGISQETVTQALELALPNDIVEALSPQIHKQDNGAQAAIIISYQGSSAKQQYEESEPEEEQTLSSLYTGSPLHQTETTEDGITETNHQQPLRLPKLPKLHLHLNLNHRRRLFLNIALILAFLLIVSIFYTVKKVNDDREQALFQSIYPTAQQYYSEGQGLSTVNATLSQERYHKAEKLLTDNQQKFAHGSKDAQQIADLLAKVDNALQSGVTGQTIQATAVQAPPHSLLAVEQASSGLAFGQDDKAVYSITSTAITSIEKTDGTTKSLIKNANDWAAPVAVVPYEGNLYVLDQKHGVLKFINGSSGFGKTSYFKEAAPDLSQAVSMAIDKSVWILMKDGSIMDYTSGKSNNITITGLPKPLNNPTKMQTDISMSNIYILDTGNSRVVVFDKNGKYQNAYSASIIAQAKDFDVSEKDKTIDILSGGKVWKISL